MKIQESAENYLETILMLSEKQPYVRSIDIATELGFSKPSVSVAMKNLRVNNLILVNDEGHITLTDEGRRDRGNDLRAPHSPLQMADGPRCQRADRSRRRMPDRTRYQCGELRCNQRTYQKIFFRREKLMHLERSANSFSVIMMIP